MLRLTARERVAFAALGNLYPSVSTRRLEQPQARHGTLNIRHDQRFRHETQDGIDDLTLGAADIVSERCRRLKSEAAAEERQPAQDRLFEFVEKPIAPLEGRIHCLLARRRGTMAADKQFERVLRPGGNTSHAEDGGTGGGELDRQRKTVELLTNVRHDQSVGILELEFTQERGHAFDEQLNGGKAKSVRSRQPPRCRRTL